jgi:hypothetical protein
LRTQSPPQDGPAVGRKRLAGKMFGAHAPARARLIPRARLIRRGTSTRSPHCYRLQFERIR